MAQGHHGRHEGQDDEAVDQDHVAGLAVGHIGTGLGTSFAVVELAVGDHFVDEHVQQMPVPGLGLAQHGQAAFRLEHAPELAHALVEDEAGPEEGDHEDGVDGVVAIEHLTEHDAAVGGTGEPVAVIEAGADPPDEEPQQGRDGEEEGQAGGLAHPLAHDGGLGQVAVDHVAGSAHDVGGTGTTGAEVRAVAAVVAEPQVHVGGQLFLEAPGRPHHFLAGVGSVFRSHGAGHGAGGALIAFFQAFAARFHQLPRKGGIRLENILCHCSLPPTCP